MICGKAGTGKEWDLRGLQGTSVASLNPGSDNACHMTTSQSGRSVGILANPAAGRDIRRLVAQASVFPIAEKSNMVARILCGLGVAGVERAYMMTDSGGIAARLRRALASPAQSSRSWPEVIFLDMPREDGPEATLLAAREMVEAGVSALLVLGGDGTHRLVARVSGEVPITALSTGTNNVFPSLREATTAGLATGLAVAGRFSADETTIRNKILRVKVNGREDVALVDACISTALWTGSKALWRPEELDQIFVTFAEADSIGLSTIAALLHPVSRRDAHGLRVDLSSTDGASTIVRAPIAPGLIVPVGVSAVQQIHADEVQQVRARRGVIALDGEREMEFSGEDQVTVRLDPGGPRTIRVKRVMELAARQGLLREGPVRVSAGIERSEHATQP